MHPSKHVHRGCRRAAIRVAVAVASSALLCAAAAGPALASARHSRSHKPAAHATHKSTKPPATAGWADFYLVRKPTATNKRLVYELAVQRLDTGDLSLDVLRLGGTSSPPNGSDVIKPGWILELPENGSTPAGSAESSAAPAAPSGSGAWSEHYTIPTSKGSTSQVINELTIRNQLNGDLRVEVFQLGGSNSQSAGGGVLLPSWVLVLPVDGSPPAPPTGPLLGTAPQAGSSTSPARPAAAAKPRHTAASGGSSKSAQFAIIGAGVLVALLLAVALLIRRRKGSNPAGQPGRRDRPLLSWRPARPAHPAHPARPGRLARISGKRASTAGTLASPTPASLPGPGTGGSGAAPAFPVPAPAWSPSGGDMAPDGGAAPQQSTLPESMAVGLDDSSWPDYLRSAQPAPGPVPAQPSLVSTQPDPVPAQPSLVSAQPDPRLAVPPPVGSAPAATVPATAYPRLADPVGDGDGRAVDASSVNGPSPSGWRMLAASWPAGSGAAASGVPAERHRVVSGDDQIEVVLAPAPAAGQSGRSTWLATSPHLVWTPLPYDVPEDGVAFACLGTGDEGCLFVDLAAAPGVISIGGDRAAAARLAESIAHQLSMAGDASHPLAVTVVGDAVPGPLPAGVTEVAAISGLGPAGSGDATTIVFCDLRSDEEAFALARYTAAAQHRVIPVVLAEVPDAPWSLTAQPSLRPVQPLSR